MVYAFDEESRGHGKVLLIVSIITTIIWSVLSQMG